MSAQGFARRGANGTKMFWHFLKLKSKGVYSGVLTLVREGVEVFRGLDTPSFFTASYVSKWFSTVLLISA